MPGIPLSPGTQVGAVLGTGVCMSVLVGETRAAGTSGGGLQLGNVFCEEIKLSKVVLMPEEKVGGGRSGCKAVRWWLGNIIF